MISYGRWLPARSDISPTGPRDEASSGSQRIIAMLPDCCTGKDQAMNRWQELVDNLLTDLGTETPGADDFRMNIDHKIWEAEQTVSYSVPMTPYETTVRRLHGFQRELIERLSKQLKNDPANESLREARSLLENPWLRVPEHQRPDLRKTRSAGARGAASIAKLLERPQPQERLEHSPIRSLHAASRFVLTDI